MSLRPILSLVVIGVIVAAVVKSKRTDADILARVGAVAAEKVKAVLPAMSAMAGPVAVFKPGRVLPVEERVRVRIDADKVLDGTNVEVMTGAAAGEVKLRGVVNTQAQRQRAAELAEATIGVQRVINEIAVPEQ